MARFTLKVKGLDKAILNFGEFQKKIKDLRPAFKDIGEIAVEEFKQNFDVQGGKIKKWKKRKYSYPWPILNKTGKMKRSWEKKPEKKKLTITNLMPYAIYHHKGMYPQNAARKIVGNTKRILRFGFETITEFLNKSFKRTL